MVSPRIVRYRGSTILSSVQSLVCPIWDISAYTRQLLPVTPQPGVQHPYAVPTEWRFPFQAPALSCIDDGSAITVRSIRQMFPRQLPQQRQGLHQPLQELCPCKHRALPLHAGRQTWYSLPPSHFPPPSFALSPQPSAFAVHCLLLKLPIPHNSTRNAQLHDRSRFGIG